MPIKPDYDWTETEYVLTVQVHMKGFERARADVSATDCFLKINAPPYLLQLDLSGEVDSSATTASIASWGVTFSCPKRTPGPWATLEAKGEKDAIVERRNRSVDEAHRRLAEARERRQQAKEAYEKELTARSLDADREKRQALERAKAEELGKARSELTQWQQRVGGDGDGNDTESEDEDFQSLLKEPEAMPDHPDYHGRGWRASDAPARAAGTSQRKQQALGGDASALGNGHALGDEERGAAIWAEGDEENEAPAPVGKKEEIEVEREEEAAPVVVRPLPPPRRQVSEAVRIAFTPTEIAHMPAREKREVELKEYKRRNLDPAALDANDVAERQPLFLKDKGDALFQAGNFEGAVNAYSKALELDPEMVPGYSNRAACFLKLGKFTEAAADCTKTLELLRPDLEKIERGEELAADRDAVARKILVKALVRRSACFTGVGHKLDALMDLERAHRIDRTAPEVLAALSAARAVLTPEDAARLRGCGDECFRSKEVQRAAECYSAVLCLAETQVAINERAAALANRAACAFQQENFVAAAADCTRCLGVALSISEEAAGTLALSERIRELRDASLSATEGAGAPLLTVAVKSLSRRAASRAHLRQYLMSAGDFEDVEALCDLLGNAGMASAARADAEKMRRLVSGV